MPVFDVLGTSSIDRGPPPGYYLLHTKDGVPVEYTTGALYNPSERRAAIPPTPITIRGKLDDDPS